jgi:hypothetical protein
VGDLVTLPAGPGAELRMTLPEGSRRQPDHELPAVPLPAVGAEVTSRAGWLAEGSLVLRAACVRAPSDRWAPGVEDLVLARASDVARNASGATLDRWSGGSIERAGTAMWQTLDGQGRAGDVEVLAAGRHWLGFVGEDRDVALCSVVCTEPPPAARCAEVVASTTLQGRLVDAPAPSWWVQGVLLAADHPTAAAATAALVGATVVAVVLARRPRPGRRR